MVDGVEEEGGYGGRGVDDHDPTAEGNSDTVQPVGADLGPEER